MQDQRLVVRVGSHKCSRLRCRREFSFHLAAWSVPLDSHKILLYDLDKVALFWRRMVLVLVIDRLASLGEKE
jgi:hypothetical protein